MNDPNMSATPQITFEDVSLKFVPILKTRCTHIYVSMNAGVGLLNVLDMDQFCTHIKDPL